MNIVGSKIVLCGVGFVITVISGIILSNSGKPLNSLIFTIHKLIAIGTVILLVVSIHSLSKVVDIRVLYVVSFSVTGLFVLALIVSGALLSLVDGGQLTLEQSALQTTLRVHQIMPVLTLAASTLSVYLLVAASGEVGKVG